MPPKKAGPGKKAAKKKVEKQIEDKTFGLKNKKKSKKVQQFVAQVEKMATDGGPRRKRETLEDKAAAELRARKKAKKEAEKEMAMLLGAEVAMKKKKKKKKTEGEGEEEADSGAGGEFKSAAEMAKEEMGAALEAAADVPPVSMVEVTLDGTMEVGEHAIESIEDEIERKRAELLARLPAAKMVPAKPEQLTAFKRKRDAQRAKEQKLADQEIYGKGGRKGLSGREVTLRKLKESGGLDDAHDTEGDVAVVGGPGNDSGAAAAAADSAAAAAATVDADVFLQGDDDDEDLDDLDDSDNAGDDDDDEEGDDEAGDSGAKAVAAAE